VHAAVVGITVSLVSYCKSHADHRIYVRISNVGYCGPGSSVGIATGYGLDGPGIEGNPVLTRVPLQLHRQIIPTITDKNLPLKP